MSEPTHFVFRFGEIVYLVAEIGGAHRLLIREGDGWKMDRKLGADEVAFAKKNALSAEEAARYPGLK